MGNKCAFSLAEVLIALALLGVVAAFTIPKVLNSGGDKQKKAVFREVIASLSDIARTGYVKNEIDPTKPADYFLQHLNATQTCLGNSFLEGCFNIPSDDLDVLAARAHKGAVLANGACITGLKNLDDGTNTPLNWAPGQAAVLTVDWNCARPPNLSGQDQIELYICYGDDASYPYNPCMSQLGSPLSGGTIRPGKVGPRFGTIAAVKNDQLFQEIFR